jgi:3-hydroxybutyryl-CoA dehydrogenase
MGSMNIAIIGFGKMASAIFKLLASNPYNITVLAIDESEARGGETKCLKGLKRSLRRGTITEDDFKKKKETLRFTHRVEDLASAEVVIEAIFEDYDEKVAIFRKLESVIDSSAILLTNTSSISIEQLAKALNYSGRFCGLHFFHPVMLINLVEIIRWADTPDELVEFLLDFCKTFGRNPIVAYDSPGSMINLILVHYFVEALYLLEEGQALPSKIDALAKKFFYIGPCESLDVIGIDFFIKALAGIMGMFSKSQAESSKTNAGVRDGFHIPYLFDRLISKNRLGKKVSQGIYLYDKDKPLDDMIEFYMRPTNDRPPKANEKLEKLVETRLLYSIFNGSLYCLQKGLSTLREIDLGVKEVLLMKEGPFTMMQRLGKQKLKENFDFLAQNTGRRFKYSSFDFPED